jgi:hypothetical protein
VRRRRWLLLALPLAGCQLLVDDWSVGDGAAGGGGAGGDGVGGGGGYGSTDPPLPVWCRFYGGASSEALWDVRPQGDSLVGAASFAGSFSLPDAVSAEGSSDGLLLRLDVEGNAAVLAQVGATVDGGLNSAIVAGADRVVGAGSFAGEVGAFVSEPMGSVDALVMDEGGALTVGTSTSADVIVDGDAARGRLVLTGVSGVGLDLGTGPASSAGFIAFADLATGSVDRVVALGAGSSGGSGHMARFSPAGDAVWASAVLGGPGITDVVCGGAPVVTEAPGQSALLKLAPSGDCMVGRALPMAILPDADLAVLPDGGLILSGRFSGTLEIDGFLATSSGANHDGFVARLGASGTIEALLVYGGSGSELPNEVVVSPSGTVFVAGEFAGEMVVGDASVMSVDGDDDVYLVKLTPALEVLWLRAFGGEGRQAASALAFDAAGNLFLGGHAEGSLACASPAPVSAGLRDMFLMRFDAATL